MSHAHMQVGSLLMDLQIELRSMDCWSHETPSAQALASETPFAVDTLTFEQWLQFIFFPKMQYLVEHELPMPGACHIVPMAEEYFGSKPVKLGRLIKVLGQLDDVLAGGPEQTLN